MSRLRLRLLTSTTTKSWLLDCQNIDNHNLAIPSDLKLKDVRCLEKRLQFALLVITKKRMNDLTKEII